MQELNLNEMVEVSGGARCVCSSGAMWESCPSYQACWSWCQGHGGMRFFSGPDMGGMRPY